MAEKSTFTPDEWKTLLESVMAPGLAITAAEPSGLWGLLQESFASGNMLAKTKMQSPGRVNVSTSWCIDKSESPRALRLGSPPERFDLLSHAK